MKVSYKPGVVKIYKTEVKTKPGDVVLSYRTVGEELGFTKNTVSRCLRWFENEQMITVKTEACFTIISIQNWEYYQKQAWDSSWDSSKVIHMGQFEKAPPRKVLVEPYIKEAVHNSVHNSDVGQLKTGQRGTHSGTVLYNNNVGKKVLRTPLTPQGGEKAFKASTTRPPTCKILHDGTKAVWKYGKWVDAYDNNVVIDPTYYPEITKD